jgi:hypothetical protein
MKKIVVTAVLAAFGVGALAFSAGSASAYVACNRAGECWHVDNRYHYKEPGIAVHPDDWYFHRDWDKDKDHHWRHEEHHDRGFYRNGVWVTF